eukprot:PRCOL_00003085-RA
MEVTKENVFSEAVPSLRSALSSAAFVAVDLEMTGIHAPTRADRPDRFDDAAERYAKLRAAAAAYRTVQFGVCAMRWDAADAKYEATSFNALCWPRAQKFTVDAGAMEFLVEHGFNWQELVTRGLTYSDQRSERRLRDQLQAELDGGRERVVIARADDAKFIEGVGAKVTAWLALGDEDATAAAAPPAELLLDPCPNRFLKRAVYEMLEVSFKGKLTVEKADSYKEGALRLLRGVDEAAAAAATAARWEAIDRQCELNALWVELVRSGKPLVVHNGLADVAYMFHHFQQPLPELVEDFKTLVAETFPGGVYDTKHVASLPQIEAYGFTRGMPLADVAGSSDGGAVGGGAEGGAQGPEVAPPLRQQVNCPLPIATHATLSPRYGEANNGGSACHEAGFDAWQTAYVFASYLRLLHAATLPAGETPISLFKVEPPLTLAAEHVGRLALPRRDFPYLSLRGDDPLEDQSNVFVITGTVPLAPQPAAGGQDAQESEVPADGEASVAAVAAAQTPVPMPRSPQEASRAAFGLGLGRWDAFWRPTGEFVLALQDRSKLEGAAELLLRRLGWEVVPLPEYRAQQRSSAAAAGTPGSSRKRRREE